MASLTCIRNSKVVGKNRKSYDDKHPENPIALRPLRDAIKIIYKNRGPYWAIYRIHSLANASKPKIAREIARILG